MLLPLPLPHWKKNLALAAAINRTYFTIMTVQKCYRFLIKPLRSPRPEQPGGDSPPGLKLPHARPGHFGPVAAHPLPPSPAAALAPPAFLPTEEIWHMPPVCPEKHPLPSRAVSPQHHEGNTLLWTPVTAAPRARPGDMPGLLEKRDSPPHLAALHSQNLSGE